jgi:hypothetical protein
MAYVSARDMSSFADIAHVYGLPSNEEYPVVVSYDIRDCPD